jgi:hypothetical protein
VVPVVIGIGIGTASELVIGEMRVIIKAMPVTYPSDRKIERVKLTLPPALL